MKRTLIVILFSTYILSLTTSGLIYAESLFIDPHIPHGETITYTSFLDGKPSTVVEKVAIREEGEKALYEITSRSKRLDRIITLDKKTMAIVSVHTVRKYQEVTLDSKLTVINEKSHFEKDEVKLADFAVMNYLFRGFPFGNLEKLKIGFYGEERKKSFLFSVKYKQKETITVNQRAFACHKLEFGLDGLLGTFLPEINAWYAAEAPHYLVRYEGPEGPPGSPRRVIELVDYKISD